MVSRYNRPYPNSIYANGCLTNTKENINAIPNGILYLKGGDLTEEIKESKLKAELHPLSAYFEEAFFETKYVVYIPQ